MSKIKITIYRKIFLTLIAIVLVAAGCGGGEAKKEPVTLKIWKPFVDSSKMSSIIAEYTALNPHVTIEYTKKNIENYEEDILNALAAREGPDIFSINNTWLPEYADKVTPAPVDLFALKEYKDSFVDVVSSDFVKDDLVYGVAMWVDSLALYYNKDILGTAGIATPPKTWADLERHVRLITTQDETGYFTKSGVAIGLNSNVNRAVDVVYLMMLQAGAIPWSADGLSPQFTTSISRDGNSTLPGVEGLDFYTSFGNPRDVNYNWNVNSDYSIDAFANGRAGFLYSYAYARELIESKSPNLNYDVAIVPQYNLNNTSVNFANYFGEVVNKQSEAPEEAWNFLKFLTSKDTLDKYYASDKQPSSRRDLIELQSRDEQIGVFAFANLTAKSFFKPDEPRMDAIMADAIDNVILRGMTVQQALGQAQTQAGTLTRVRN